MTSNGKQFTVTHEMLTAVARESQRVFFFKFAFVLFCYNIEILGKQNFTVPLGTSHKVLNITSTRSYIVCVRLTSSNSQIQNKRATKGFILIRHKRYQIHTCLQLSSSIASFVWKPAHFELRSYGSILGSVILCGTFRRISQL